MQVDNQPGSAAVLKRSEVVERVKRIVAEFTDIEPERMQLGQRLIADLGCDSLDVVEIAMEIEEQFDISIPDGAVEEAQTIEEIVDGVSQLLDGCEDA